MAASVTKQRQLLQITNFVTNNTGCSISSCSKGLQEQPRHAGRTEIDRRARRRHIEGDGRRMHETMRKIEHQRERAPQVDRLKAALRETFLDRSLHCALQAAAVLARYAAIRFGRLDEKPEQLRIALQLVPVRAVDGEQDPFKFVRRRVGSLSNHPDLRL